jgi:predicted nucleic acid-binding Zn finger protein
MSQGYDKELTVIETACQHIASSHKLADPQRARLEEQFGDRFKNALELVEKRKVHKYRFKPSGRTIWAIRGRKGVYQVIPETNFCNCDDYYFRVMDGKRALCYHIIAQKVASALGRYESSDLQDTQYSKITEQWRTRPETAP